MHHSAQLIKDNDCKGLGSFSEEALESNNKDLRRFMETYSRKFSGQRQLTDVLTRALERSDPFIQWTIHSYKKQVACSLCNSDGHTRRSCKWNTVEPTTEDSYDNLFEDLTSSE